MPMPEVEAGRCSWAKSRKCLVLLVLAFQNCSLMMITSYSRLVPGPKYLTSTAVLAGEVVKTAVVLGVLTWEHGLRGVHRAIKRETLDAEAGMLRYALPAVLYTIQNNLWYFGLSNLDSVSAAVAAQAKILTTAVFSMLLLSRKFSCMHWSGLLLLMLGLVVMKAGPGDGGRGGGGRYYLGLLAMLGACTCSGYAGTYLEKLFKQFSSSVWTTNLRLQVFCLPVSALATLSELESIAGGGFFQGWSGITCAAVLDNAIGGFLVAFAMKYADNILKTFAVSMSLVLNCLLSATFLSVHLTPQAITGVALVIAATFLYSVAGSFGTRGDKVASYSAHQSLPVDEAPEMKIVRVDPEEQEGKQVDKKAWEEEEEQEEEVWVKEDEENCLNQPKSIAVAAAGC